MRVCTCSLNIFLRFIKIQHYWEYVGVGCHKWYGIYKLRAIICHHCSLALWQMRLPSKPYSSLPIFSLGPSALQKGESFMRPEKIPVSHHRSLKGIPRSVMRIINNGGERQTERDSFLSSFSPFIFPN